MIPNKVKMLALSREDVSNAVPSSEIGDIIDAVEMAANHVAGAYAIYEKARQKGIGTEVPIL